jgi:hypothetical protein
MLLTGQPAHCSDDTDRVNRPAFKTVQLVGHAAQAAAHCNTCAHHLHLVIKVQLTMYMLSCSHLQFVPSTHYTASQACSEGDSHPAASGGAHHGPSGAAAGGGAAGASSWVHQMSPVMQAEWLANCYRVRLDDGYERQAISECCADARCCSASCLATVAAQWAVDQHCSAPVTRGIEHGRAHHPSTSYMGCV